MMHRQALMSEIQGSPGDSPQINYFTHREGSNQMPMQGSSPGANQYVPLFRLFVFRLYFLGFRV
jgi:hypothetical protein